MRSASKWLSSEPSCLTAANRNQEMAGYCAMVALWIARSIKTCTTSLAQISARRTKPILICRICVAALSEGWIMVKAGIRMQRAAQNPHRAGLKAMKLARCRRMNSGKHNNINIYLIYNRVIRTGIDGDRQSGRSAAKETKMARQKMATKKRASGQETRPKNVYVNWIIYAGV